MKAEKTFVKLMDIKAAFYHRHKNKEFNLHHYESIAWAITSWLEANHPQALGGFWNGEMNPPTELSENAEIGIIYFEK